MAFLPWKDQYSVHIDLFDEQHKKLFSLINNLDSSVKNEKTAAGYREAIDGLIEYTKVHFSTEEEYMIKYSYSGYAEHKNEHEALTAGVIAYREKIASDEIDPNSLMRFLMYWLVKHIMGTDMKYTSFFSDKLVDMKK